MMTRWIGLIAGGLVAVACGGSSGPSVTCGDGTVLRGSTCVAESNPTCGTWTQLKDNQCVPATLEETLAGMIDEVCECETFECADAVSTRSRGIRDHPDYSRDAMRSLEDKHQQRFLACWAKAEKNKGPATKSQEAAMFVKKMYDGARAYYMDQNYGAASSGSFQPMPPQFPAPGAGPVPPIGECCKQGGQCQPDASYWESDVWVALQFSVDDPNYYSYVYEVNNNIGKTDGSNNFTVRAIGDLDCDGIYSTFEMTGAITEEYADGPAGNSELRKINELE